MDLHTTITHLKSQTNEFLQKNLLILVHVALFVAQTLWGGLTVWSKGALESGMHASAFIIFRLGGSVIFFHLCSFIFYRKEYLKIPDRKNLIRMGILGVLVATFSALVSENLQFLGFDPSSLDELTDRTITKLLFINNTVYIWNRLNYCYQQFNFGTNHISLDRDYCPSHGKRETNHTQNIGNCCWNVRRTDYD
jgi:hypothetical protein